MSADGWRAIVETLADRPELHAAWLNGLSGNPAASGPVLCRIITVSERLAHPSWWLAWRAMTGEASAALARHPERKVRLQLAQNPRLSLAALRVLGRDPDPMVRMEAVDSARSRDRELYCELVTELEGPGSARGALPKSPPPELPLTTAAAQAFVASPDPLVRARAAGDARVPQNVALGLAQDPDDQVRISLSMREDLSEEQRAAIPYVVPDGYHDIPGWLGELLDDPEAIAVHAASSHVLIRRTVAMARHLPPAAVALLADDEDYFVKLTLAQRCDDAPHELIIEMFGHWHGLKWSSLRNRPNFVRHGMATDFVTHPNDRLRWAALHDPTASPEIVEALSHDESDQVHTWAVSDPRLPLTRLQQALGIQRTARSAAGNPQLPEPVMHTLLDYAGVENT